MFLLDLYEELYLNVRAVIRYNGVDKALYDKAFIEMITAMHDITNLKQQLDLDEEE